MPVLLPPVQWVTRRVIFGFFSLVLMGAFGQAAPPNVILITLDGVRWHEVFHGTDSYLTQGKVKEILFKNLLAEAATRGFLGGDRADPAGNSTPMSISNFYAVSLPGYQSIFGGRNPIFTLSNSFGRIGYSTFPERLLQDLRLERRQIASFSSWKVMHDAIESQVGTTYVNAGLEEVLSSDPEVKRINQEQARFLPAWEDSRLDRYTWAHAMYYLRREKPRFLFIGLIDADSWCHLGNYGEYVRTLKQYDFWLGELFQVLKNEGAYGRSTTVFVTTDHGRGPSWSRYPHVLGNWKDHSWRNFESREIWFYGQNFASLRQGRLFYRSPHLDIRPTIERIFGLPTSQSIPFFKQGSVMKEFLE